jgi:hypothetical protein
VARQLALCAINFAIFALIGKNQRAHWVIAYFCACLAGGQNRWLPCESYQCPSLGGTNAAGSRSMGAPAIGCSTCSRCRNSLASCVGDDLQCCSSKYRKSRRGTTDGSEIDRPLPCPGATRTCARRARQLYRHCFWARDYPLHSHNFDLGDCHGRLLSCRWLTKRTSGHALQDRRSKRVLRRLPQDHKQLR